jgi:phosphohistidine phosphatase
VRYLTVVRHADSTPATPGQSDFDRPLSERGHQQCAQLRRWADDRKSLGAYGPVTALVSSSVRTVETYQRAFEGLKFALACHTSELIYNGHREVSGEDLLIDLAAMDPVTTSLLVVAHNPSVLELVAALATPVPGKVRRGHFPKGAAYVVALPDDEPVGLLAYELVDRFVPD